ncbi:MAG: PKD domain-containing protein [Acidobacteria bacterium]|nr:PKD domain-containing protein [Acidobacteriota bacterium]
MLFNTQRFALSLVILLAAMLWWMPSDPAQAQDRDQVGREFPQLRIPAPVRGADIVNALGRRLPEVAAFYGKSEEELTNILNQDDSAWIDHEGRLLYICDSDSVPTHSENDDETGRGRARNSGVVTAASPYPLNNTFLLHSRPGASKVIFLDFDGHTTTGTSWNNSFNGGASIITPPYDIDGNPSSFSSTELERIQYIWQRVAEDFAAFDVDVTTEDPGVEALRRTTTSDQNYGIRVAIGGSSYDWYGAGAGGVAYVGSFRATSDTPCFVFTAQLGTGNEKYTAEATSHEVGHTLGLSHDGVTGGTAYYQGHSNWAPIMGVGYYRDVTQWSKGDYNLANNKEDDLAVMQNYGITYRADDHGNSISAATPLSGPAPNVAGKIERNTDLDFFSFTTGGGAASFTVAVAPRGPNLDVRLTLYNAGGGMISWSNASTLGTSLSANLSAGVYYLSVEGAGTGDAVTAYTDYSSLGDYVLTGSFNASNLAAPVAGASATPTAGYAPLTVAFSSAGSSDPDGSIVSYSWNFGNGVTSSLPNPSYTYTSAGSFTATLTVTDNDGLSASANVVITVSAPPNQLPTAVASATPTAGYAPLTVAFSSAGSSDPDGTIVGYSWNFGNGATSTAANPSYTYTSTGTFIATLTVTDDRGGQASSALTIVVSQNPNNVIFVGAINMSLAVSAGGNTAQAEVIIVDASGAVRPGATVTGSWSGLTTGAVTGTTNSQGRVVLSSKKSNKKGNFTFTVTNVSASGYTYDASRNVRTGNSIANF